ncbi:MAG: hypothetical protein R3B06_01420 [Kofleriaceae bacterium]
MKLSLVLLPMMLAPLALAACGGAEAAPPPSAPAAAAATSTGAPPGIAAGCETFLTRAKTCTSAYIPALVDLRIELDRPAGIAEFAATDGRDAVIAQAMTEWADDSQPAAITATCAQVSASLPADQVEPMRVAAERCMAMTDCAAFSACAMELQRPRLAGQ